MSYNAFGLDTDYFKEQLSLILRSTSHYTPGEMQRALKALSDVAQHQADSHAITRGAWVELPTGTHYKCPNEAQGKRIAVKRRNGEVDVWGYADHGPDWKHDGHKYDIVAWLPLEGS